MLEFLDDMNNYEERKVDRFDGGYGKMVSTARVSDGRQPFETAVAHPEYNGGDIIVVEAYDTIEQARAGHAKWEGLMRKDALPDTLVDCSNSEVQSLCTALGEKPEFSRFEN